MQMKKLTLILSMMMVALAANAQTEKGKTFISAASELNFSNSTITVEYDNEEMGDKDASNFSLSPTIGYFVADGFAIGVSLNIENSKEDDYTSNSVSIGPIAKYYIGQSDVKPYIQGGFYFGSQTEDIDSEEAKFDVMSWDIGGGVAFFLNDFASIDAGLGYGNGTITSKDDDKLKIKASGVALNVGFSLYF